ncbi:MAG: sigma-70 family RNA polymerase sigma factor [Planctomycetia bacterium]|nr:sigma-70 family RNA polymerase sigma factor [Planctomycetia bacterium]
MDHLNSNSVSLTKDAAAQIFLQYYDYVRSVAFRLAPAGQIQDDISHDVFVEFTEHHDRWILEKGKIKPLLRKITQNIALQYWRRYVKEQPEFLQNIIHEIWDPTDHDSDRDLDLHEDMLLALKVCLQKLTPRNRKIVEMHYFKNASYEQIMKETNRTVPTLYSLMTRIRSALHQCIKKAMNLEIENE